MGLLTDKELNLESLSLIINNKAITLGNDITNFYGKVLGEDTVSNLEWIFIGLRWKNKIFAQIKNGHVELMDLRKELLLNSFSKKNNTTENIYFKVATSLAFAKYAYIKNDWQGCIYYLLEAERLNGYAMASQDSKLYTILQNEQTSKGGKTKAENFRQLMEPVRQQSISLYQDLNYRKQKKINNLSEFSRHFCRKYNENLLKANPEISDSELLKESTVKRWINPPKPKKT